MAWNTSHHWAAKTTQSALWRARFHHNWRKMLFSSLSGRINTAWSYYFIPDEKTREDAVVGFQQTNLYIHKEPGTSASMGLLIQCWDTESLPGPGPPAGMRLATTGAFHPCSPAVLSYFFPPLWIFLNFFQMGKRLGEGSNLEKLNQGNYIFILTSHH